ncbi:MAG: RING finger domain-containing protein [Candidatus Thorarchaeota archaeon]
MATCIICHKGIIEGVDIEQLCPNGHPAHHDCLKNWLIQSNNCPLCNETYSSHVLLQFQKFINEKEEEKLNELRNAIKQEEQRKIQQLMNEMIFKKFEESINVLINQGEFDYAPSRLEFYEETNQSSEKNRNVLFLKGKINYLKGRYDLAINQLFKLVKDKYDYPDGFLYLGKAYEALGLVDKAKWAYERIK